jgi:mono/diheme cytochrome c family protein
MNVKIYSLLAVSSAALFGCWDNAATKLQYMPDMADAPTLKPQENYLPPPPHSVPINAVIYPKTVEEAEKTLKNPLQSSDEVVAQGKHFYETYCIPCHGAAAKGDGSITDLYPRPPDITAELYKTRGDGFFFHRITFGANIMPGYGHATTVNERWAIVHYLRDLQRGDQ